MTTSDFTKKWNELTDLEASYTKRFKRAYNKSLVVKQALLMMSDIPDSDIREALEACLDQIDDVT